MRGRLRRKLQRQATRRKMAAVAERFVATYPGRASSKAEAKAILHNVLFACDMEHFRRFGRPLFRGLRWIKTRNGVEPRWARRR